MLSMYLTDLFLDVVLLSSLSRPITLRSTVLNRVIIL